MRAFRIIRQSLVFNPRNDKLIPPSRIIFARKPQNFRISRHFSPILLQSFRLFHRSSFSEASVVEVDRQTNGDSSGSQSTMPNSHQKPRAWSVYGVAADGPRIEGAGNSSDDPENEVENRPNSSNSEHSLRKETVKEKFSADTVLKKKKGKSKVQWVCSNCGNSHGQWWGSCTACHQVGTVKQFSASEDVESGVNGFEISENAMRSWLPEQAMHSRPVRLKDVICGMNQLEWRIPLSGLFGAEVARVLGGGVVPGSLVLVGGDPGVGKSTLLLQVAAIIAEGHDVGGSAPVLFVSGEESVEQIGNRADRMGIETEQLFLYSSTDVEDILGQIQRLSPRALVVDSIQTVYLKGVTGDPGGMSQVKECTSALLRFAKKTNIPVLLIGHVTKSGEIAGPRILEHIVDVVLYMEGEKHSSYRLLRSVKNRFGSTDELGVFEMLPSGLQAVPNPSEMFLTEQHSDSEHLAGLAVAVIIDGSRTFLIEVQALCVSGTSVSRHVNGVPANRADMIISVLMKQAGLRLEGNAIFLNIVSGVSLTETAGDLAVAAAICSSFLEFPVPNNIAFIGEVGLGGELRTVPRMEKRVNTVAKLGYKMCVVPKSAVQSLAALGFEDTKLIGCSNIKEVIDSVFRSF
ncbi:hypothetical protein Ancab_029659 [Ancistrocladus abbreviatus]